MKYDILKVAWIDCVFAPMQDANSTTVEIMCKAWSIYETKKNNGISHFLEHLFFKWGKKYPTPHAVAQAVDKFGWMFNAYTWEEFAWYYVKCAPEFINKAIDVLGDMMIYARFPEEELEREKWVVIQELKMYEDNPMALVLNKWQEYYYGDNSYGRSIVGTEENIKSFDQNLLNSHKQDLYSKDNLIIVIAGRINNLEQLKKLITENFGSLPDKKRINKPAFPNYLPTEKIWFFDKKTEQNHLVISSPGFNWNDERRYAANVLATILGGNMSSRLFQNIREKQWLCYYINATHYSNEADGVFVIRAWIDKKRFDFGLEKIFQEIQNIADGNFTAEEFQNALGYTEWQIQMWIESSDEMSKFLWPQYLIYNKIETLDETLKKYKNLKIQDIQSVANMISKEKSFLYYIK